MRAGVGRAEELVFSRPLLSPAARSDEKDRRSDGQSNGSEDHRLLLSNQALVKMFVSSERKSTVLINTIVEFAFSTSS